MHLIKRELRDLISRWLVPGLAALLPWSWCTRIFWQLARWPRLMGEEFGGSRGGRLTLGVDPNDPVFDRRFRYGFVLEHADAFRALTFGWRGLARTTPLTTPVQGGAPGLCFFFSFNQGLAVLASLRAGGYATYSVLRSAPQRPPGVGWSRYAYMRLRLRMANKVCGHTIIETGGARQRIAQAIADGGFVCVGADTPPLPGTGLVQIAFPGGRTAWWRSGVLKLALELNCPLYYFVVDMDWKTGQRTCRLCALPPQTDLSALASTLNAVFLDELARQPELWYHWPGPHGFLQVPEGAHIDG